MSWTDIFPLLTDEQVSHYQNHTTPKDELILHEWFSVARTINSQTGKHLIATSLFWKNVGSGDEELPKPTRELMLNAKELGLVSRYAPWDHYVQPLLDGAAILKKARPDVVFRVYLAADLEFLIPDLVKAGCEVKLMLSSSIRHNPGALWRFLALEEEGRWVTLTDADLARDIVNSVERTERIMQAGLGLWRLPYILCSVKSDNHPGFYRPINASQLGATGGHPVELLMKAFLWHTLHRTMPNQCTIGPKKKGNQLEIFGTIWPTYGFDEWFLIAVLYPRMAFEGVLTFYPINQREMNHWFSLDIEYVTWANPKSEIFYYDQCDLLSKKGIGQKIEPPQSRVLEQMLAEQQAGLNQVLDFPGSKRQEPMTLVVARYQEDLTWLLKLPKNIEIVVYNKGPELVSAKLIKRINFLITLPNRGRESDTYLHHVQHFKHGSPSSWTVFTQGDPFPHSPNFIKLLGQRDCWQDVQPLTSAYVDESDNPPRVRRMLETDEWIRGIPIRTELLSANTLRMNSWNDAFGGSYIQSYCDYYHIPLGWSVSGYFLETCGLAELAEKAWRATLVRSVYAAIFAVKNERLGFIPRKCIPRMRKLACGHSSNGFVFERLWLHLFGLPFIGTNEVKKVP
jgi:hypothetical protein